MNLLQFYFFEDILMNFTKKIIILGACLLSSTAHSAEIQPESNAQTQQSIISNRVENWNSFYIGGTLGSTLHTVNILVPDDSNIHGKWRAPAGGFHLGYDFQLSRIVLGMGGAFDVRSADATGYYHWRQHDDSSWKLSSTLAASLYVRLGFALSDNLLVYGVKGIGWADYKMGGGSCDSLNCTDWGSGASLKNSSIIGPMRSGNMFGGGIEYKINHHWSVSGEYTDTDYGNHRVSWVSGQTYTSNSKIEDNSTKISINYAF